MSRKKAPSLPLYRNIAVSFSALTLLLVVVIVYFSTARATIVVVPRVTAVPLTFSVAVAREASAGTTAILGEVFSREVSVTDTFPTALVREEDAKAGGPVRIVNTTGNAQTLIATTRFFTGEKILFRLKEQVVVPPRGEVKGTLVADVVGSAGNVGPTRFTIPGLRAELQEKIYGESDAPMTGGRKPVYRLTANEVDAARAALTKRLEENVRSEAQGTDGAREALALFTVEPQTSVLSEKLGAAVKEFSLTVTARARGVVVPEKDLHALVVAQMKTTLPDDQRLLTLPQSAVTTTVTSLDEAAGTARLLVKADGASLLRSTSPVFDRTRFVGRTVKEVETILKNHGGIAKVQARLSPFFMKRLPRLPDHITIQIQEP